MSDADYAAWVAEAFESYRPRFKVFNDEALELALAAVALAKKRLPADAFDALQRHRFLAIAEGPLYRERFVAIYEEAGRHDLLEAEAKPGEWGSQLPLAEHLAIIDRLAAAGHGARVLRIWRHFIGKVGGEFWYWVRERDAALAREARGKPPPLGALTSAQSAEIIPAHKATFLDLLRLAEPAFARFGSERDHAWLAGRKSEAAAEKRETIAGKPDPAPMTEDLFWQVVSSGGSTDERLDTLPERLAAYSPKAIQAFGQFVADKTAAAYRADLWALAYLLMGGASDDAFDAFRNWLVLQGRGTYEATLADPDGFDVAGLAETPMAEALPSLVEQAYELRAGKPMPRLKQPKVRIGKIDEDAFAAMLPKVAAATA